MARHLRKIRRKSNTKYSHFEFQLKLKHLNLLKVFDVSLEMSRDPKNYFGFT